MTTQQNSTTTSSSAANKTPTSKHSSKQAQLEKEFEELLNAEATQQKLSALLLPVLQKSKCFASWLSSLDGAETHG
jgi:hypothetical protein